MKNIEEDFSKKETNNDLLKQQKQSAKWNHVRKTSVSLAILGACAGVYGDLTETKKDGFLVPAVYTTAVVSAAVAGCSQKKKETADEKLGKPSKVWNFIKKVSFITSLIGLGATIIAHLTEDKGDDKIIPWAAPLAILSGFLTGYAFQKNKDALKMKPLFQKKDKETNTKTFQEKILSSSSILWDTRTNMPLDKTIAKTLTDRKLSLDPKKIVKSTLPFFKVIHNTHTKI